MLFIVKESPFCRSRPTGYLTYYFLPLAVANEMALECVANSQTNSTNFQYEVLQTFMLQPFTAKI